MRYFSFITVFLLCTILSCKKNHKIPGLDLEGIWKGSAIKIGDSISTVDLSPVRLVFNQNSRYYYSNNIAQSEAGTYFIKDSILVTNDTTSKGNKETAVHVIKATKDSLVLRMNMDSVETLMFFVK